MSQQSPRELERDAERVRAQIADTAEQLKSKMSPGQLIDEVMDYFKDGDTSQMIGNLKHQVRDNPLALALVGSGLAWLMAGSGPGGTSSQPKRNPLAGNGHARRPLAGSNTYGDPVHGAQSEGYGDRIGEAAGAFSDQVGDMVERVGEMADDASDSVRHSMHDLKDSAAESFNRAAEAGSAAADRVRTTFLDALDREPLVLGAIGVAVGAAIGAMLPPTRVERAYLGKASETVREGTSDLASEGIGKAREAASDAYMAARDEADRQGLTPKDKPVAEKIADVARAAGSELSTAASDALEKAENEVDETSDRWAPTR
jgi:ElaB/YqjD/DUF883 family membrane-anchored ribosome-binding protein